MKKLQGLQTYKSIAFSYEQIPLTHFIIYRFPFSFLNTLPSVIFLEKVCDFPCIPCLPLYSLPMKSGHGRKQRDDIYFTDAAAIRSAAFFTISLAESVVRTEKRRYLSPYFIT